MNLTCASCSGSQKSIKYNLKKFPSFEELCLEGLENKVTLARKHLAKLLKV